MGLINKKKIVVRDEHGELYSNQWSTPDEHYEEGVELFKHLMPCRPMIDAAASPANSKCPMWITREQNALTTSWMKMADYFRCTPTFWLNPPYSQDLLGAFVSKAYVEATLGAYVIALLPVSTSPQWFHNFVAPLPKDHVHFRKGRIKFIRPEGMPLPEGETKFLNRPGGDNMYVLFTPKVCD